METNLSLFNNSWYKPAGKLKMACWYFTKLLLMVNPYNPFSGLKILILKMYGAKIGKGVVIKPNVNIKYPWLLTIGNHSWIGEGVWIDNLAKVTIGNNVCISQGALLLCGNHNYKESTFDLMLGEIIIEDGVWIGAKAVVCPGVKCKSHSILSVGSVATKDMEPYSVYQGNPAVKIKDRIIEQ
jgi:putative colanic acid biosynthesis acetyltransferase WcaF